MWWKITACPPFHVNSTETPSCALILSWCMCKWTGSVGGVIYITTMFYNDSLMHSSKIAQGLKLCPGPKIGFLKIWYRPVTVPSISDVKEFSYQPVHCIHCKCWELTQNMINGFGVALCTFLHKGVSDKNYIFVEMLRCFFRTFLNAFDHQWIIEDSSGVCLCSLLKHFF